MKRVLWYDLEAGLVWAVIGAVVFLVGHILKEYWLETLTGALIGFLFFGWRYGVRGQSQ